MTFDETALAAAERLALAETNYAAVAQRRGHVAAPTPAHAVTASHELTNETLRAEFDRDPKIRGEFLCFEDFAAFKRAETKGLFKMLGGSA
ncbi:hypothetical protein [Methylocystis sp.]|uniref:hypothetical protein n=1 Tax=Methylocystis sp. TaxID=1911079 RepID=UPI0025DCCDB6|nr:hypothetical protein [Methylocystis sp.]